MSKIKTSRKTSPNDVICAHAALLFREKGYNAASMRELADRMGIEAPSLYNHIGSKAEMLENICNNVSAIFIQEARQIQVSELSPEKKLEALIRQHIKITFRLFNEVYVSNYEWKHLPTDALELFLAQRRNYEQVWVQVLKAGMVQKEFRKSHPHITVLTILSALKGIEFVHKYRGHLSNRVLENNIVNQLLKGVFI